jgi:nitrogen fixation/metabolism regulation signal transduction histidine kinase
LDLDRQYVQQAVLIKSNLVNFLSDQEADSVNLELLNEKINELSNTISSDIHLFSSSGKLISSNRANIFEKKILSNRINPKALAEIEEMKRNQFIAEETVGKLRYKSVYLSIPSQNNQYNLGILAVPFFESEAELHALISDILSSIFNTFVIIFILFLAVSYFLSKNLTFPFRLLTEKLKATNLENNEPMVWDSMDEIGKLVNEYNNMLFKLEKSKNVLASTEKESAWREMAKQVAHEIKNPLTPIKLTLQHLLRLEKDDKLQDKSVLRKALKTIIHQVDSLSEIASSFSTFAKMPLPKNEIMDFKKILNQILELFKLDQKIDLIYKDDTYQDSIFILGDDQLFGRVISNLIINGIQAVDSDQRPIITIWLWKNEDSIFLEINDNGKGIRAELIEKIFLPNFSTKSQGSGLGLAIAKSGVETAGGKIWVESKVGEGSTFYLSFPIVGE